MKTILLLLLGFVGSQVVCAQTKDYFQHASVSNAALLAPFPTNDIKPYPTTLQKAAKKLNTGWYSYAHTQMDPYKPLSGQAVGFLAVYPDSNLWASTAAGGHFNWWLHGIGISFDPNSSYFLHATKRLLGKNPQFKANFKHGYAVDSVHLVGSYVRKHNGIDTLYIELVAATDSNKYLLSKTATSKSMAPPLQQSTINIANTPYISATNSLKKENIDTRIIKLLDGDAANDTNSAGVHSWTIALPKPMLVPADKKVVVYVHFASGTRHPLGFKLDQANIWYQYSTYFNRPSDMQKRDCNAGLYIHTRDRYALAGNTTIAGVPYLNVAHYIRRPKIAHYPLIALHLNLPQNTHDTLKSMAIHSNEHNLTNNKEPKVVIKYKLKRSKGAVLQIYNKVGLCVVERTLAAGRAGVVTVPTSSLASGSYHYIIENKNEIIRGNVIIVH